MKAKVFLSSVFLWASIVLYAQEQESKENIRYSNISEVGFVTTSPRGFAFELTSVNGFSVNKKHHVGIGVGFGGSLHSSYQTSTEYTPVFFNYRYCFKLEKRSPHVNISAGGLLTKDGYGIYSSITAGIRHGKFSFSSGISFMAIYREEEVEKVEYYDPVYSTDPLDIVDPYRYIPYYSYTYTRKMPPKWYYPFGVTVKCGFAL
jgi:hypothetical protein